MNPFLFYLNQSTNLNNRLSENKFELKEDQFKRDDGFLKLIYDDKTIDGDLKNLVNAHKKHHELEGISVPNPPSIDNNSLLENTYYEFYEFRQKLFNEIVKLDEHEGEIEIEIDQQLNAFIEYLNKTIS